MHRHTDCPTRIGNAAGDRLTDPPCRIRTELITFCIIKLVYGLHQTHVSLLDQIQERHASSYVLLGNTYYQSEVRFGQFLFGFFIALLYSFGQLNLFLTGQQRYIADLFQVHSYRILGTDTFQDVHITDQPDLLIV